MTNAEVKQAGAFKYSLGSYEVQVNAKLDELQQADAIKRLWQNDSTLWTGKDEGEWLGWLEVVQQQLQQLEMFKQISNDISQAGFTQAVLLGMGGSSLCVEVLRLTFGHTLPYPDMHVLDSTVPAQVLRTRQLLDLSKTLMIVASKSGGTTEPNVLCQYFYDETRKVVGDRAGDHFIAITDPGSSMEKTAAELKFRRVYYGVPSIGGRFSALSNFGMVPSAVMGEDVPQILQHAKRMVEACGPERAIRDNPGALLGTVMGVLAAQGVDKVTVFTSPVIDSLGPWLEQLMAESTGKEGRGLIPIAGEKLSEPGDYGSDRLFVYVRVASQADATQDQHVKRLMESGAPVVFMEMNEKVELGAEFFKWEFATAVAGSVLGINAFNQPNVQESKDYTKKYLAEYSENGKLPEDILLHEEDGIRLYVDAANKSQLEKAVGSERSLDAFMRAHIARLCPGDYYAMNAYVDRDGQNDHKLEAMRLLVMEQRKVATTIGFGPRFLHSTGQLHKGGPNSGVFLQITSDDQQDVDIPKAKFTFGILKQAQSLGDFLALSKRGRRLLRIHLPADVSRGLDRVHKAVQSALT